MRDPLRLRMKEMGLQCRCIRCREYGFRLRDKQPIGEPQLTRLDYTASGGREIFLSFEDEFETLFGLIRLRIQDEPAPRLADGVKESCGLIRELHVFGPEIPLSQRQESAAQHKGYGRALLKEAERIAKEEFGKQYCAVLSGVGARDYYRGEGYELRGYYMVKRLAEEVCHDM
jgi:elongator complex protein 3